MRGFGRRNLLIHITLLARSCLAAAKACYYGPGEENRGPDNLVPCIGTGESACCLLGDVCYAGNVCWDWTTQLVYQYGCTDPAYQDESCPFKCGWNTTKSPWVGLQYCEAGSSWVCVSPESCGCQWEAAQELLNPPPRSCHAMGSDARVALYATSFIVPYLSLPPTEGGKTSYFSTATFNDTLIWTLKADYTPTSIGPFTSYSAPTNVVEVFPNVTPAPGTYSTSSAAKTSTHRSSLGASPTGSSTSSAASSSTSSTSTSASSSGLSSSAKTGIGVGVGVGAVAIAAIIAAILYFRRKRRSSSPATQSRTSRTSGGMNVDTNSEYRKDAKTGRWQIYHRDTVPGWGFDANANAEANRTSTVPGPEPTSPTTVHEAPSPTAVHEAPLFSHTQMYEMPKSSMPMELAAAPPRYEMATNTPLEQALNPSEQDMRPSPLRTSRGAGTVSPTPEMSQVPGYEGRQVSSSGGTANTSATSGPLRPISPATSPGEEGLWGDREY